MVMILVWLLAMACWATPAVAFAPMTPVGTHHLRTPIKRFYTATTRTVALQLAKKQQEESTNETTTTGQAPKAPLTQLSGVLSGIFTLYTITLYQNLITKDWEYWVLGATPVFAATFLLILLITWRNNPCVASLDDALSKKIGYENYGCVKFGAIATWYRVYVLFYALLFYHIVINYPMFGEVQQNRHHYYKPEPFERPNRRDEGISKLGPNACRDLPVRGEIVDVLVDKQEGRFVPGIVKYVQEADCSFQTEVVRDNQLLPETISLSTEHNWVSWIVWAIPWILLTSSSRLLVAEKNIYWDKEFDKEYNCTRRKLPPPRNLTYGSKRAGKDVVIKLTFHGDGSGTGSVSGGEEEFTVIAATWTTNKVRWTEKYDKFSRRTIRGKILPGKSIEVFEPLEPFPKD